MTPEEFTLGLEVVMRDYPETRVLPGRDGERPLRVAPVPIPVSHWGGGVTRLLVVFNLATHDSVRPRGLLGPEWKLPGGTAPMNASPVYEFGEAWQAFSWVFPWPPALGVLETAEAYLGRFNDPR
ncbi:MAG TPA: hypothetical protein VNF75_04805 [Candidatus Dormibacteraeota bacterium]|nr:hypothetical protein [Candidatus Dormibacteraeota bacterium]HVD03438.1 hypothetical protein [Candidatus Dormibacteraeota bacterium]